MIRVFVYGTLRRGMYNFDLYYKGHVVNHRYGYVKGSLYTIIDKVYPALIEGNDTILGEVMDMDESFSLDAVDKMEGFYYEGCIDNEYDKVMKDIYDEKGKIIDRLPVYLYNLKNPKQKHSLGEKIECNDYIKYREKIEAAAH